MSNEFVPSFLYARQKKVIRRMTALPAELGGMGITISIETASVEYKNSSDEQNLLPI